MFNDYRLLMLCLLLCGCSSQLEKDRAKNGATPAVPQRDQRQYTSITEADLQHVLEAHPLVLVEFGEDITCHRCQQMTPVVNDVAGQFRDEAHVVRIAYSPSSRLGKSLQLRVCPTYVLFQHGRMIDRVEGSVLAPILISKLANSQGK